VSEDLDPQARARLLSRVGDYYSSALERHGATPAGVDWSSAASQALRFEQLTRLLDLAAASSINDYGCGYGALLDFLRARGFRGLYRGCDVSASMRAAAGESHAGDAEAEFVDEPGLAPADYTLCSGLFNVKLDHDEGTWRAYVFDTLDRLRAVSTKGYAFNALTSYADPERMRKDLHYADPRELFDHCRRRHSRRLALLHDYPLYEFTLVVTLEGGA
jgi:SAM-dependent methyltransferase